MLLYWRPEGSVVVHPVSLIRPFPQGKQMPDMSMKEMVASIDEGQRQEGEERRQNDVRKKKVGHLGDPIEPMTVGRCSCGGVQNHSDIMDL